MHYELLYGGVEEEAAVLKDVTDRLHCSATSALTVLADLVALLRWRLLRCRLQWLRLSLLLIAALITAACSCSSFSRSQVEVIRCRVLVHVLAQICDGVSTLCALYIAVTLKVTQQAQILLHHSHVLLRP